MPLTLTLRVGEWVNVGAEGAVMVVDIQHGQIKLKLEFPRDLAIVRPGLPGVKPNQAAIRCLRALDLRRLERTDAGQR